MYIFARNVIFDVPTPIIHYLGRPAGAAGWGGRPGRPAAGRAGRGGRAGGRAGRPAGGSPPLLFPTLPPPL